MQIDRASGLTPWVRGSTPGDSALRRRYADYCRRQAVGLIEVIPRDGVRPLYCHAREWAVKHGVHERKDPMTTLHRYCRELLPLPSFDVWLVDYETNRLAHLKEAAPYPHAGEPSEPVGVERREMGHGLERWEASLEVFRDGELWRGYIRFQPEGNDAEVSRSDEQIRLAKGRLRTGDIFCEDELQDLRDRFLSFTSATLSAFLRSILP